MESEEQEFEQQIARDFRQKVHELISDEDDKDALYQALRSYHSSMSVERLVEDLKVVVNEPRRLQLFDDIRALIPLKHQLQYDTLAPRNPPKRPKSVRLRKHRSGEVFGFCVRGGAEHGVGVYVSHVTPDSLAWNHGIRVGDHIVRINGYTIDEAIHEEVLNLIKTKNELVLKVRGVGMLPHRDPHSRIVRWSYVPSPAEANRPSKIFINVIGTSGLGCSICSGPALKPGIFFQMVKPGGLAEEAGMEVGDQIVQCNGTSFMDITHSEAVTTIKGCKQLDLWIIKGSGADLFDGTYEASHPSQVNGPIAGPCSTNREVHEHVLQEKIKQETELLKRQAELERRESTRLHQALDNAKEHDHHQHRYHHQERRRLDEVLEGISYL